MNPTKHIFLPLTIICMVSFSGYYIGVRDISYQLIITITMIIGGGIAIINGKIYIGLAFWVMCFALGYRVIYLGVFRLHPLTVFIIAITLKIFVDNLKTRNLELKIPNLLIIFGLFCIWGLVVGFQNGISFDLMLNDFVNVMLLFPIFIVVFHASRQHKEFWLVMVSALFLVGTLIALLGLIETNIPVFRNLIPGLVQTEEVTTTGLFTRSLFAFWGSPAAVYVCVISLPFALPIYYWNSKVSNKILIVCGILIQLFAIYYAGYRSVWLLTIMGMSITIFLQQGLARGAIMLLVVSLIIVPLLPLEGRERFSTVFEILSGEEIQDSSLYKRELRTLDAWDLALRSPFGSGWGASGWTHNDLVQFAANLGLVSVLVFCLWYLKTLRLALIQSTKSDYLLIALISSFCISGGLMLFNGLQVLTQLIVPVWFIWALLEARLKYTQCRSRFGISELPFTQINKRT